ncbi:hypothetical protein ABQG64_26170, partial [Escherichia coli]
MRTSPARSVLSRRLAAAVVLPGLLTTSLILVQPAVAGTSSNASICNGVVNQLAHRGTVQENLLRAAAKKNADVIAKLEAEKVQLQAQEAELKAGIEAADKVLADLAAEELQLENDEAAAAQELARLTAERAKTAAKVAETEAAISGLKATRDGVVSELTPLQEELAAAEATAAALEDQAAELEAKQQANSQDLAAAKAELETLQ